MTSIVSLTRAVRLPGSRHRPMNGSCGSRRYAWLCWNWQLRLQGMGEIANTSQNREKRSGDAELPSRTARTVAAGIIGLTGIRSVRNAVRGLRIRACGPTFPTHAGPNSAQEIAMASSLKIGQLTSQLGTPLQRAPEAREETHSEIIANGDFRIDLQSHKVTVRGPGSALNFGRVRPAGVSGRASPERGHLTHSPEHALRSS